MTELPDPLSPPDCDLRGYDFMPLLGNRLFNSHLYRKAIRDPRAGLAAIKLWWVAWLQCPSGSLPDDDDDLAMLADCGLDVKAWSKMRPLALHGFIKCSDGRLYHPLLCEEAKNAFERRRKERDRKATNRAKKMGQTQGQAQDGGGSPADVPRDKPGTEHGTDRGQEQGRHRAVPADRTGQDRTGTGQGQDSLRKTGQAAERDASTRIVRPQSPSPNDPREAWAHLADEVETNPGPNLGRPIITPGGYLDVAARETCIAARLSLDYRGPWEPLIRWQRDGIGLDHIVAVVTKLAKFHDYEPPNSLKYFDRAVRERR